jgi:glucose/arabinose dehydrogenase
MTTAARRAEALEVAVDGLHYPTSVAVDGDGTLYVAESGLPFGGAPPGGRVWHITPEGQRTLLVKDLKQPVNGITLHEGALYVSEGGRPSAISRLESDGSLTPVVTGMPGPGNYHTNMCVFGPDGKLYFTQGSCTNMGVVGLDAYELGWLGHLPHPYDVPGYDVVVSGETFETWNPLAEEAHHATADTGPFAPWGEAHPPGTRLEGRTRATAAVLRCNPDGSDLELVAWGVRNGFGMGFLPDGRLLVTDQGADDRGSRPVADVPDYLWEITPGAWYGWPDFMGGVPVTDERFLPHTGRAPRFILANHDELPPPERPLAAFPTHTAAVKFAVDADGANLYVALFGDEVPMTAPHGPKVGRSVVRVSTADWSINDFCQGQMLRPIDVAFAPDGSMLVVDFGAFEMRHGGGLDAEPGTGKVWRLPADAFGG